MTIITQGAAPNEIAPAAAGVGEAGDGPVAGW